MNLKARLKRLEGKARHEDKPLFIVMKYSDESEAEARAAYPELPFPERTEDASVIYIRRSGSRPAERLHEDRPGYDPRGLCAVLAEIDGQTQCITAWKERAAHGRAHRAY